MAQVYKVLVALPEAIETPLNEACSDYEPVLWHIDTRTEPHRVVCILRSRVSIAEAPANMARAAALGNGAGMVRLR